MNTPTERLTAWALRLLAGAMLLAGMAVLVAGAASSGMLTESAVVRTSAGILLQIGATFVVAGAAAIYLSRPRGLVLPNERAATTDAERPQVGGWLIALAILLVALPVWMVIRLLPFLTEWRRVIDVLATSGIWEGAGRGGAGIVLLPLAGVLLPPLMELAAMLAFVISSAILLILLLSRSPRFPRLYLVCMVLAAALVMASVRAADGAMQVGEALQRLLDGSPQDDSAPLREGLGRYTSTVVSTATVLMWTLGGYLVWVMPVILSRRTRATFASSVGSSASPPSAATDVEAITRPPGS